MAEMREARLILPRQIPYPTVCWVRNKLLDHFGGFTSFEVAGGWRGDNGVETEDGVAYDVAVPDRPESDWLLAEVVMGLFDRSDEQSVYVRNRDGTVTIVDRPAARPVHADPVRVAA